MLICMEYVWYLHEYWWAVKPKVDKNDWMNEWYQNVLQKYSKLHVIGDFLWVLYYLLHFQQK